MNVTAASAVPASAGGLTPREQRAEALAQQKLKDARSAVEILKSQKPFSVDDANNQRKAAARQRVAQLKAQIQSLQMSGFVDSKRLAQLARELKAAVKAYGSAGGSMSDLSVAGTQSAASLAQTNETPADATASGADTTVVSAEAATADAGGQGEPESGALANADPYRQAADAALARPPVAGGSDKAEDREFFKTVRELANQFRGLARRAAMQASNKPDDTREMERAIDAAFKEIENASRDLGPAGVSITV